MPNYPRALLRAGEPPVPWVHVRYPGAGGRPGVILVMRVDAGAKGLLADFSPWLYAATAFFLLVGLGWFFLARSIASAVSRATVAAEAIAALLVSPLITTLTIQSHYANINYPYRSSRRSGARSALCRSARHSRAGTNRR